MADQVLPSQASARPRATDAADFTPLVCVVDFNHHRGPEIEHWIGGQPAPENDWQLIPYMALPDGAHQSDEEFSYFSLVHRRASAKAVSVFGISCMHQIDSAELLYRPPEVTRSAVQKAVVAIMDQPQRFGALRERLSIVTSAWFAQKDFRDLDILQRFQESLIRDARHKEDDREQYFGLSLRELVHTFKWQTLVLLKCLLLQRKTLFFGSNCERLCQVQFSLISLIPGLVRRLQDCADPQMNRDADTRQRPDSVRTSDRTSLLTYAGLPLQLFGIGSFFGPYTPLQQLDTITDQNTKSFVVGSTNSLLLQQREAYCDALLNLDDNAVSILSPGLKSALTLTAADRRWIDFLTQAVNDTWDPADPSRPSTHGYAGSEEFIRLQFEEYLIALLSSAKYHQHLLSAKATDGRPTAGVEADPASDFSITFLDAWQQTENFKLWNRTTDDHLFDIVEPRHPCAGGLTIDDVQRRLAAQVAELHLDERFNQTKEVVNKRLTDGRAQVSSALSKVWSDIESMREAQRRRAEELAAGEPKTSSQSPTVDQNRFPKPDLQAADATVAAAGQRAGAYLSSWGTWAAEKRRSTFVRSASGAETKSAPAADPSIAEVTGANTLSQTGAADDTPNPPGEARAALDAVNEKPAAQGDPL